jgi:hypothetical protein
VEMQDARSLFYFDAVHPRGDKRILINTNRLLQPVIGEYQQVHRRCVSQPTEHQAILLQRLGLNLPKNLLFAEKFLKKME